MTYDEWKLQASPTPHQGRRASKGKVREPEDIVRAIEQHLKGVEKEKATP